MGSFKRLRVSQEGPGDFPATISLDGVTVVKIVSVMRAANVVTVTTDIAHGLNPNDHATLANVSDSSFNGRQLVATVPNGTTFTFAQVAANASSSGGYLSSREVSGSVGPLSDSVPSQLNYNISQWESVIAGELRTTGAATSSAKLLDGVDAHSFGAAVPSGTQVNGVQVAVTINAQSATGANIAAIQLMYGGNPIGQPKTPGTVFPTGAPVEFTFGDDNDLWGLQAGELTPEMVNSDSFGFRISVFIQTVRVFIYACKVKKVAYGTPGNQTTLQGTRKVAFFGITRTGYWTKLSPPQSIQTYENGTLQITGIPIGSNWVARGIAMTSADGESYYHVKSKMFLDDNTTTTLNLNISDEELTSGLPVDYLLTLEVLQNAAAVAHYADRLVWIGEENALPGFRNLGFDGGFGDIDTAAVPINYANWTVSQICTPSGGVGDVAPDWQVAGAVVTQVNNAAASAFVSDFQIPRSLNPTITGTLQVTATADDDELGFVFCYQDAQHFYLFDWRKVDQLSGGGAQGLAGMHVKKVSSSTPLVQDDLWRTASTPGKTTLLDSNTVPWATATLYTVTIALTPTGFTITVKQGVTVIGSFNITDSAFNGGKFGFYNMSQDNSQYSGFASTENQAQRPLGWTAGASGYAGGFPSTNNALWGQAYKITGDGLTAIRGHIYQPIFTDAWAGIALLQRNQSYTVRARVKRSAGLATGRLNIQIQGTGITDVGLQVTAAMATTTYQEFEALILSPKANIPGDIQLHIFADQTPTVDENFYVDEIRILPTDNKVKLDFARVSRAGDPESYDGANGFLLVDENNGWALRNAFRMRNFLYLVKEHGLHATQDDGQSEPSEWTIEEISSAVGTPSTQGVAVGDGWAVIANPNGAYLFTGGTITDDDRLTTEIEPDWSAINWNGAGKTVWVKIDLKRKRILFGVPMNGATQPNKILMLDYQQGFGSGVSNDGTGRKWSLWNLPANSAAVIENTEGTRVLLGSNDATGKIREQGAGATDDDGLSIANGGHYDTAYLGGVGFGGQVFGELVAAIRGSGTFAASVGLANGSRKNLQRRTLADPATRDLELLMDARDNRASFRIMVLDEINRWWELTKLAPYMKPDPWLGGK